MASISGRGVNYWPAPDFTSPALRSKGGGGDPHIVYFRADPDRRPLVVDAKDFSRFNRRGDRHRGSRIVLPTNFRKAPLSLCNDIMYH